MLLQKNNLYKLPWTTMDNPNGWIEPTTYCQLKCPGCYRGLAEENPSRKHEAIESQKKEVDWLVKHRNVQTISIAGGEPLCYPNLDDLITYIHQKKLKTKIYTNGVALTKIRLLQLKKAGATEVIIHVDKFQKNKESEEEINHIRRKYCDLFRDVKGVNLGFIMPLSRENTSDLPILSKFFQENADVISLVVFTVFKEMLPRKTLMESSKTSMQEIASEVQKAFNINYCAYLGKKNSDNISWLFSLSAYTKKKSLGSFDQKFYKAIQQRYYDKRKKFFITVKNNPLEVKKLLLWPTNNSARKIFLKAVKAGQTSINTQVVLIIDPPEQSDNKWDLCDGCPDAMMYKNELVPSCLLERIKEGEKITIN